MEDRTICRTDNRNRSSVIGAEEHGRRTEGQENAKLCCCAKNHQFRIAQNRSEVDHCTNADEQNQREQLIGNTGIEQSSQRPLRHLPACVHLVNGSRKAVY